MIKFINKNRNYSKNLFYDIKTIGNVKKNKNFKEL